MIAFNKNRKHKKTEAQQPYLYSFLLLWCLFLISTPGLAQLTGNDVLPGDACSPEDAVVLTADENDDGARVMTCLGGVWVATLEAEDPTAGGQAATKAYVDSAAGSPNVCTLGPSDCPDIGDLCDDGTIYIGIHPYFQTPFYMHPTDWGSTSWSSEDVLTGAYSVIDGQVNLNWILANKNINNYNAIQDCHNLNLSSELGYTDWYLPAQHELTYIRLYEDVISEGPADNFVSSLHWSSTEAGETSARKVGFGGTWNNTTNGKSLSRRVRCVRRD